MNPQKKTTMKGKETSSNTINIVLNNRERAIRDEPTEKSPIRDGQKDMSPQEPGESSYTWQEETETCKLFDINKQHKWEAQLNWVYIGHGEWAPPDTGMHNDRTHDQEHRVCAERETEETRVNLMNWDPDIRRHEQVIRGG